MDVLRSRDDLRRLSTLRDRQEPLVLVPTMGALHEGHLELVRGASRRGRVVVSIFVNPTQFAPAEDLDAYPRDLDRDLEMLGGLPVAAVFAPPVTEMYPRGEGVMIEPGPRARVLCGAVRPGHFRGVLTVVAKLFHLVRPRIAVFGRKDAQQCLVIDEMVRDLAMPVRLLDLPTVREPDGLALSSRNAFLSADDRLRARCLSEALQEARRALAAGQRSCRDLRADMLRRLAAADAVDYAEVRSVPELDEPPAARGRLLLAVAARVGGTRLIDNLALQIDGDGGVREAPLLGDGEGDP